MDYFREPKVEFILWGKELFFFLKQVPILQFIYIFFWIRSVFIMLDFSDLQHADSAEVMVIIKSLSYYL